ncbi:MAG: hypothetical protein AB6733_24505 [Clostridiaceae bacterium]
MDCEPKTSSWNQFQKDNKGKYHSQQDMADAYYKANGIDPNDKTSLRELYMGSTPGKDSKTGREVIEAMERDGMIERDLDGNVISFQSKKDGKWYPISEADMSHKNEESHPGQGHRDAVRYWNEEGKYSGAKSEKVRDYMKNSKNYYLEYYRYNRSDGAKIRITYDPPEVNID